MNVLAVIARFWALFRSNQPPSPFVPSRPSPIIVLNRQARRLKLAVRPIIAEERAGGRQSAKTGHGLIFSELRAYEPGDDVRHLDWNATARLGRPHVRRYLEERTLTVRIFVDVSASMRFGHEILGRTKLDQAKRAALLLAKAALLNGDRAGIKLVGSQSIAEAKPESGIKSVRRIVRLLASDHPLSSRTDWSEALTPLRKDRQRGLAIVLSDFLDAVDPASQIAWRAVSKRHDAIAVRIFDPLEEKLPDAGLLAVQDSETGERRWVDSSSAKVRTAYVQTAQERFETFRRWTADLKIDRVDLSSQDDPYQVLKRFFDRRGRRGQQP